MTTDILEPAEPVAAGAAAALPPLPATTRARVDTIARNVVFWGLMGIGTVLPLVGGVIGLLRDL